MMRRPIAILFVLCVGVMAARCSSSAPEPTDLKPLQRTTAGATEVVLLAHGDALKPGKDEAVLEFRGGNDHHLVDVGEVKMNATMTMAGMPPMMGSSFVTKTDVPGRYAVETDLSMAGTWRLSVEWDGPAGKGSASFSGTVR